MAPPTENEEFESNAHGFVTLEQPEWGEEIVIGESIKLQRPLNGPARSMLGGYTLAVLDLYDHFQGRIDALEAKVAALQQQDST